MCRDPSATHTLPALVGTVIYGVIAIVLVLFIYAFAHGTPGLALPIVIMGLSVLVGGTWFFVHWRTRRVEKAWSGIGAN